MNLSTKLSNILNITSSLPQTAPSDTTPSGKVAANAENTEEHEGSGVDDVTLSAADALISIARPTRTPQGSEYEACKTRTDDAQKNCIRQRSRDIFGFDGREEQIM